MLLQSLCVCGGRECVCNNVLVKTPGERAERDTERITFLSVDSDHEEHLPPVVQRVQDRHRAASA